MFKSQVHFSSAVPLCFSDPNQTPTDHRANTTAWRTASRRQGNSVSQWRRVWLCSKVISDCRWADVQQNYSHVAAAVWKSEPMTRRVNLSFVILIRMLLSHSQSSVCAVVSAVSPILKRQLSTWECFTNSHQLLLLHILKPIHLKKGLYLNTKCILMRLLCIKFLYFE